MEPYDQSLYYARAFSGSHPGTPHSPMSISFSASTEPTSTNSTRHDGVPQKRHQVKGACASCASSHVKCSEERPCLRCVAKGLECVVRKRTKSSTKSRGRKPRRSSKPGACSFHLLISGFCSVFLLVTLHIVSCPFFNLPYFLFLQVFFRYESHPQLVR